MASVSKHETRSKRSLRLALALPLAALLVGVGCAEEGIGDDEFAELGGRVGDLETELGDIDERIGVLEEEFGVEEPDE